MGVEVLDSCRSRSGDAACGRHHALRAAASSCNEVLQSVARDEIPVSYDEAMAICLLLAEAADAAVDEQPVRDAWVDEARLMIELILGRTDE